MVVLLMAPKDSLVLLLQEEQAFFHKVVPYDSTTDKLLLMDFSDKNIRLSTGVLDDTNKFTSYITNELSDAHAKYGIGGYNEERIIYSKSVLFNQNIISEDSPVTNADDYTIAGVSEGTSSEGSRVGGLGAEPRRLHLGIDIWGKSLTKVMAPLDGIVHSVAFNCQSGDYGATIILSHRLKGVSFHTLYGHLSAASIKNLQGGVRIQKGNVFAKFGIPQENGNWPPHLHFQIVRDMQGMKGDYPGVCKMSERELYLANCPNPDLILNMMQHANA
jgi:hypothetical protein